MISIPQRITMTDIAAAAGVARSTVSKALRNDSRLPTSRCQQIQRIASELGYRPHPMVSALMSQIHRPRRSMDPCCLSWIDFCLDEPASTATSFSRELLLGAQARAKQLCYQIDVHRVGSGQLSLRRLQSILYARRQWGLIIPPVPDSYRDLDLEVDELSCVTIGASLRSPVLHCVSTDYYHGGQIAFNQAIARGARKIGLVLSRSANDGNHGKWLAAFLERQQSTTPIENHIPPLIVHPSEHDRVAHWQRRYLPDSILVAEQTLADEVRKCVSCPSPELIWLMRTASAQADPGLDHKPRLLGAAAVDRVVDQIHRNERGEPRVAQTLLLPSRWVEPALETAPLTVVPDSETQTNELFLQ